MSHICLSSAILCPKNAIYTRARQTHMSAIKYTRNTSFCNRREFIRMHALNVQINAHFPCDRQIHSVNHITVFNALLWRRLPPTVKRHACCACSIYCFVNATVFVLTNFGKHMTLQRTLSLPTLLRT
jgi:hypothetical protein